MLFDEYLNKKSEKNQMDIYIRYWHVEDNKVITQYMTSAFIGHSTAEDMLKAFYKSTEKIDFSKLLQISMDGPSVNWKFYENVQSNL